MSQTRTVSHGGIKKRADEAHRSVEEVAALTLAAIAEEPVGEKACAAGKNAWHTRSPTFPPALRARPEISLNGGEIENDV